MAQHAAGRPARWATLLAALVVAVVAVLTAGCGAGGPGPAAAARAGAEGLVAARAAAAAPDRAIARKQVPPRLTAGQERRAFEVRKDAIRAVRAPAYTVAPGDTLCAIAAEVGHPGGASGLFAQNRAVLDDPDVLAVGQVLDVRLPG